MPHICSQCGKRYENAADLNNGCPACGCGRFEYVSSRKRREKEREPAVGQPVREDTRETGKEQAKKPIRQPAGVRKEESEKTTGSPPPHRAAPETPESIRILEPGRYDVNLLRLASSDDRVVRVGDEDSYLLDLHSMMRKKKKK